MCSKITPLWSAEWLWAYVALAESVIAEMKGGGVMCYWEFIPDQPLCFGLRYQTSSTQSDLSCECFREGLTSSLPLQQLDFYQGFNWGSWCCRNTNKERCALLWVRSISVWLRRDGLWKVLHWNSPVAPQNDFAQSFTPCHSLPALCSTFLRYLGLITCIYDISFWFLIWAMILSTGVCASGLCQCEWGGFPYVLTGRDVTQTCCEEPREILSLQECHRNGHRWRRMCGITEPMIAGGVETFGTQLKLKSPVGLYTSLEVTIALFCILQYWGLLGFIDLFSTLSFYSHAAWEWSG